MFFLDDETKEQLEKAASEFHGNGTTLESALGAVLLGRMYGWRVLKMIHSPATYRKYEKILGIKFRDICKEETKLTQKSLGMKIAAKLNNFWDVVRGVQKVKNKGHIE